MSAHGEIPRGDGGGLRPQPVEARHRLTVTVSGELVDVLALSVLAGRPPGEVASELVLDGLRQAAADPDVDALVRIRRRRRRFRVVR